MPAYRSPPARLLAFCLLLGPCHGNGEYEKGGEVVLYANKVGPFANPNEVYAFYNLPYCAPTEIETKRENLGALLKGDRPTKTRYDIKFKEDIPWKSLCKVQLGEAQADKFKQAIVDDYYFEMLLDELPIWGYVGELETKSVNFEREFDNATRYYLFTHLDFSIAYNHHHIIEVNVSADPAVETAVLVGGTARHAQLSPWQPLARGCYPHSRGATEPVGVLPAVLTPPLEPGKVADFAAFHSQADPLQRVDLGQSVRKVEFSYSVKWTETSTPLAERMARYAQYSFLPQSFEIHWLSIINSFVLVLLLTGFLSIILMRVLKNDQHGQNAYLWRGLARHHGLLGRQLLHLG